jgi:hypothetical protein
VIALCNELQTIEMVLPEDIERLRHSKKRDLGVSERLELREQDVVVTVSSIEVSWRCVRGLEGAYARRQLLL